MRPSSVVTASIVFAPGGGRASCAFYPQSNYRQGRGLVGFDFPYSEIPRTVNQAAAAVLRQMADALDEEAAPR